MRQPLVALLFLLLPCCLPAQTADSLHLRLRLPVQARLATSDNLDNIYLVTTDNALEKYAPDGRLLTRYTNNRLGAISAVDASNPLKIMVWFAGFRTIILLDRSLTPLGELNLIQAGYPEVRTVALAADGNLWLYDETAFKLRKLSPDGMQLNESQDFSLLWPDRLNITCLRDNGYRLLASDAHQGILWFDPYAQFVQLTGLPGVDDFQLGGDTRVIWFGEGQLHFVDTRTLQARTLPLPGATNTQVWLGAGRLMAQTEGGLMIFSF